MKPAVVWFPFTVLLAGFSTLALDIVKVPQCGRVTCSQGDSTCTVEDIILLPMVKESGSEAVQVMEAQVKLCCTADVCSPCLHISIQINSSLIEHEERDHTENVGVRDQGNVVMCYSPVAVMPACKNVHFNIRLPLHRWLVYVKLSLVVCDMKSLLFSSEVSVNVGSQHHMVKVPSVEEVCSTEHHGLVEACDAPRQSADVDQIRGVVNLSAERKRDNVFPLVMCLKQERNGNCKKWTEKAIPLHSVTPCMCIQMWWDKVDQRSHRSESCPFKNTDWFQRNVWANVSVSVVRGKMNHGGWMLSWNVSAPCRLEAQVWLCRRDPGVDVCREHRGFKQPLSNGLWMENRKGLWQVQGAFEDIDPGVDLCMMVKIQGMDKNIGPFCPNVHTSRWGMSLLILFVMVLLTGIAVFGVCFLYNTVKQAGREGYIMLLSPPDADGPVSEQVCELGSLLVAQGFRVCVDLWNRAQLGSIGPLPWLHSQLHLLDTRGGRVLVVLTRSAWEKAQQWGVDPQRQSHLAQAGDTHTKGSGEKDRGSSPYTDVFSACLSCIHVNRQQGCVGKRFTLVTFESHPAQPATGSQQGLPELLQGLPWFHLPTQTKGLLSALSGDRQGVRWRWNEQLKGSLFSNIPGFQRDSQSGQPYQWVYSDVRKNQEAEPLQKVLSTKPP